VDMFRIVDIFEKIEDYLKLSAVVVSLIYLDISRRDCK